MNELDLEIYNGQPTDDASVWDWCRMAPYFMQYTGAPTTVNLCKRGDPGWGLAESCEAVASGWLEVEIFPAFVERLRALALRLTFDGSELQAEYRWPEGWIADGPVGL